MSELDTDFTVAESGKLFLETEPREIPYYEFTEDGLDIYDPVWGKCEIGRQPYDQILLEIARNPLVCRTMSIEQLTLDRYTATIPATGDFAQYEHMWGSAILVRKLSEKLQIDDREKLILQLRAFLSDLGHTAYRHLGDWLFQGMGGPENEHDKELAHLLEVSGIREILQKHDIATEEVVFPEIEDWVECPAPDLCVDRVDYGCREIRRWLDINYSVHKAVSPEAFCLDSEGRLVMTGHEEALNFAKAYLLLATENWLEPAHRLQLYLQQELVRYTLTNGESRLFASNMDKLSRFYPRDYMYTFDFDITWESLRTWDPFLATTRQLMENIGQSKRRNFTFQRKSQLNHLFKEHSQETEMPRPLEPYGYEMYQGLPMLPTNLEIIPVQSPSDVEDFKTNPYTFDVALPSLKQRSIDPLFINDNGEVERLSEADMAFRKLLNQQQAILAQEYVARIFVNPETKEILERGIAEAQAKWPEALQNPRMTAEQFRQVIGHVAMVGINHRLVRLDAPSFSSFLDLEQ